MSRNKKCAPTGTFTARDKNSSFFLFSSYRFFGPLFAMLFVVRRFTLAFAQLYFFGNGLRNERQSAPSQRPPRDPLTDVGPVRTNGRHRTNAKMSASTHSLAHAVPAPVAARARRTPLRHQSNNAARRMRVVRAALADSRSHDKRPASTVIVGGGPTGLLAAIALARRGWANIEVWERLRDRRRVRARSGATRLGRITSG